MVDVTYKVHVKCSENRKSKQKCCRLSIYDVDRKAILQRKHAISLIEVGDPGGMLEGVTI